MIKLKQLLLEYNKQEILNKMYQYWKECLQKYFDRNEVGGRYPRPNFEIKYRINKAAWFKYRWLTGPAGEKYRDSNMTIGINPDFAHNDEDLKSNVYHETIHYYEFLYFPHEKHNKNNHENHGDFFKESMNRINSGEGKQLVSINQQVDMDSKSHKKFWVYGYKIGSNYSFSWTQRKNNDIINFLSKTISRYDNVYLFETDNYIFKKTHQQIGKPLIFVQLKRTKNPEIIDAMIQYAEKNNTYKKKEYSV